MATVWQCGGEPVGERQRPTSPWRGWRGATDRGEAAARGGNQRGATGRQRLLPPRRPPTTDSGGDGSGSASPMADASTATGWATTVARQTAGAGDDDCGQHAARGRQFSPPDQRP
ncbi:hypothetical protein ACLOJK_000347 [Asimina triloba]